MADLLAVPGVGWVLTVAFAAGFTYGFAGSSAALIYLPLATIWLAPPVAVGSFAVAALSSLVTVVPRAWPLVDRRALAVMLGAAFLTVPAGVAVLRLTPPEPLRWLIAGVTAVTLAALVSGWRYRVVPGLWTQAGVGAATGVIGGATGLLGPVVILFHLSGQGRAEVHRASILVFLTLISLGLLPHLAAQGLLSRESLLLGLAQLLPYALGTRAGQELFDPAREGLYRRVAYGLIALSVVLGVPKGWL